jgi:SAM-dependent methyltransferase
MGWKRPVLPYFDEILARIATEPQSALVRAFGTRHVHWGYYDDPNAQDDSPEALAVAAERLTQKLIAMAAIRPTHHVVDVGCGFGGTLGHINEHVAGVDLVGVNIDVRQLARANQLVLARNGNTLQFVAGNACSLPLSSAVVDRMLAVECIFHFPSRLAFLREAARVLRPGGRLVLSDFVPEGVHLHDLALSAVARLGAISGFYGTFNWWPPCTLSGYRWLARNAGLRLLAMEDITAQTLPTYPALLRMISEIGHTAAWQATRYISEVSAKGWVRYLNLAFERR